MQFCISASLSLVMEIIISAYLAISPVDKIRNSPNAVISPICFTYLRHIRYVVWNAGPIYIKLPWIYLCFDSWTSVYNIGASGYVLQWTLNGVGMGGILLASCLVAGWSSSFVFANKICTGLLTFSNWTAPLQSIEPMLTYFYWTLGNTFPWNLRQNTMNSVTKMQLKCLKNGVHFVST